MKLTDFIPFILLALPVAAAPTNQGGGIDVDATICILSGSCGEKNPPPQENSATCPPAVTSTVTSISISLPTTTTSTVTKYAPGTTVYSTVSINGLTTTVTVTTLGQPYTVASTVRLPGTTVTSTVTIPPATVTATRGVPKPHRPSSSSTHIYPTPTKSYRSGGSSPTERKHSHTHFTSPATSPTTFTGYGSGNASPTGSNSGGSGTCSTGPVQCCNSVQSASSPDAASMLGLLGVVLQDLNVGVGLQCSPINILGVGSGGDCKSTTVCCENNNFNGLINIGCSPIIL